MYCCGDDSDVRVDWVNWVNWVNFWHFYACAVCSRSELFSICRFIAISAFSALFWYALAVVTDTEELDIFRYKARCAWGAKVLESPLN